MSDHLDFSQALRVFQLPNLAGQDPDSLRRIYHQLARQYHPDSGGNAEDFIRLRQAYSLLKRKLKEGQTENPQTPDPTDNPNHTQGQQPNSDPTQDILESLHRYKVAYKEALDLIQKYENIFNTQIRIAGQQREYINRLIQTYENNKIQADNQLKQTLDQIQAAHHRKWWEYIIPIPKINQQEYIRRYNQAITEYNQTQRTLEKQFLDQLIQTYRQSFQDILDILEI